jgi:hypothetical protein
VPDTDTADDSPVMDNNWCFCCGYPPTEYEYYHAGHRYADLWICSDECNDMLMEAVAKDYGMIPAANT